MGWEMYITKAETWSESADNPISSVEWLKLVEEDEELSLNPRNGEFNAIWRGESEHIDPWLDWNRGCVYSKQPDVALYCKMLQIAERLNAKVLDEDDREYVLPSDLLNPSWAKSAMLKRMSLWERFVAMLKK
ncbi:hypothetical protein [Erwinia sp. JUb26]|uniref:hypothetical protein n=1 Tax=Erwinia sp. JUb26 TaxID=2485126 RepID=UPI000F49FBA5|nr:hypothetical protein [Erwinia sp. JUb26]ROR11606.1 hypothetical protein EC836_103528 [Erwinia sp. JUb26]